MANLFTQAKNAYETGKSVAQSITGVANKLSNLASTGNIKGTVNSEPTTGTQYQTDATFKHSQDWRVRLSIPSSFQYSELLAPLKQTNGLVFVNTPSVTLGSSATYSPIEPAHNNYQFLSYSQSKVNEIIIECDFYNETPADAKYWVAATQYLRSVSKMFYGDNATESGAPPPVIKLNGYGDFVFNNVPVVVKNFTVSMPRDVDYISTSIATKSGNPPAATSGISWAPTKSNITVTLLVAYSRERVRNFSLSDFVEGKYIADQEGFI